ncbi:MAG TPA: PIN domain-containing protein [Candidatus Obscuribacter sp.]|nr:PIN domain-containing protein [Candidatus Melainabacteria bacterium]HND07002.1 PIN domain-containing protein [Candidatus Obscuribacter sp.]
MTSKEARARQLIFADSNVFIEALYLPDSAAAAVIQLAATSAIDLITCEPVIRDVENAILAKLTKVPTQLDTLLKKWAVIVQESRLAVVPAANQDAVRETYKLYIASMRHANDIPILAVVLEVRPDAVLSGNYEHFNSAVASKSGIPMMTCSAFIELLARPKP